MLVYLLLLVLPCLLVILVWIVAYLYDAIKIIAYMPAWVLDGIVAREGALAV